jgi:hypothetical protein
VGDEVLTKHNGLGHLAWHIVRLSQQDNILKVTLSKTGCTLYSIIKVKNKSALFHFITVLPSIFTAGRKDRNLLNNPQVLDDHTGIFFSHCWQVVYGFDVNYSMFFRPNLNIRFDEF